MNSTVKSILEKIKSKYAGIDTILLFGSATSPDWTPTSDIDIFLIDAQYNDEREGIVIDGVSIELQKDNFNNIASDIENERGNLLHRNVATMMVESYTISTHSAAKLETLKSLAQEVLESKSDYTDTDVEMWRYSIDDYLGKATRDLQRNDDIAFYIDTHYVIQNALELTLATHGAYMPKPRRLAKLLQSIAPEFYQIFLDFTTEPDPRAKLDILRRLRNIFLEDTTPKA